MAKPQQNTEAVIEGNPLVAVLLQGIPQAGDPFYERFGLIIPCNGPASFEIDPDTLEALQSLPYIRVTLPEAAGEGDHDDLSPDN